MKRIPAAIAVLTLSLSILAGCGASTEAPKTDAAAPAQKLVTLKVGATPAPHAEILKFIKPLAEKQGIDLQVVEFTDYVKPNLALADKELDANYFQHVPYLTDFSTKHKLDLVSAGGVHLEPLGLYSTKVQDLKDLKDGAMITVPDDATNEGRALNLLAQNGLLTLKDGVGVNATPKDIVGNPKHLVVKPLNAEQLPRTLQDAAAAVINTNYYLEAQKNQGVNARALARESAQNNPYVNIVAVRKGDENRPEIQKLMQLLRSDDVKKFIETKYAGAVIPAF